MLDFTQFSLAINVAIFAVAAGAVWLAGSRLTHYADAISRATGLGQALIGVMLLAWVTSLPEIGVTATASVEGNAELAVNNLIGSIALQVALLAVVDFVIGKDALTAVVPEPTTMLEGSLNVILISFAAGAMVVGDVGFYGVGLWAWGCLLLYIASVWALSNARGRTAWLVARGGEVDRFLIEQKYEKERFVGDEAGDLRMLLAKTTAVAVVVLIAGFVLARSGDAIAQQSGLGQSFVGFVVLAFATSLPELSTALTAARLGLYTMAISDILGTNIINVALIFLVDLLDPGDPVLNRVGDFAVFGALLAVILTALFLAGLAERRDRSIFRMGYDSVIVLLVYAGGIALLYTLRPAS
jgi:cation:H+ antiporter